MASTNTNDNDPANILSKTVKVHSITARQELNGTFCTVKSYLPEQNRYIVQFPPTTPATQSPSQISLRADNLTPANYIERTRYTIAEMKQAATALAHDPQTRAVIRQVYSEAERRLPPRVKPEYAVGLVLLLMGVIIYVFGFTRVMFLSSILLLVGSVILPDVMAGAGVKGTARNFPSRWRAMVVEGTGFQWITERMALGGFVFLLLMTGSVLIKSGGGGGGRGRTQAAVGGNRGGGLNAESLLAENVVKWTMEDVYKMGFDDAAQVKDHGASLPTNHASMGYFAATASRRTSTSNGEDNVDWNDYESPTSPTPPKKKGGLGMGSILSLLAIGRAVKDMGFNVEGKFDFPLLVANVRLMEKWKLGFLGIAIYRVVSSFL